MDNMKTIAWSCVLSGMSLWYIACIIFMLSQGGRITPPHPKAVRWAILIVSGVIAVALFSIATYMAYIMGWTT